MNQRKRQKVMDPQITFFDEAPTKKARLDAAAGPLPWIGYEESTNSYTIFPEATKYLETLNGPIAVVSVVGLYRTGKSYLLNRLTGASAHGFQVSPTTRSCTKGLWLMQPPIQMDGYHLLVVDTEGLGSLSASADHDIRVFSLALLLSGLFLYNSTGAINESALNNLSLVAKIAQHVRLSSNQEADERALAECFPKFLWVCRDFALQLVDDNDQQISSTTYLNNALKPHGEVDLPKNKVRNAINGLFPSSKRDCVCLVRPVTDEAQLQHLDTLPDEQLRPEFLERLTTLKALVHQMASPVQQDGMQMTGPLLAQLSKSYVEAINQGSVPAIQDSWTMVSEMQCRKTADSLRSKWRAMSTLPDAIGTLTEATTFWNDLVATLLAEYDAQSVGSAANAIREALQDELKAEMESSLTTFQRALQETIRNRLREVHTKCTREATSIANILEFFQTDLSKTKGMEHLWYEEAFPSLTSCIEQMTFRMEKQNHELQRKVDSADLTLATCKAECDAKVRESKIELEQAQEKMEQLQETVEAGSRERDELERRWKEAQEETVRVQERLSEAQAAMETLQQQTPVAVENDPPPPSVDNTKALLETQQEKAALQEQLDQAMEDATKFKREKAEALEACEDLQKQLQDLLPLKSQVQQATERATSLEREVQRKTEELEELEGRHEQESMQIQQEAMDTVKAIREVLKKERGLMEKHKASHEATLKELEDQATTRAKSLEQQLTQAEELARQRRNALEEYKANATKEREALRSEVERYATIYKQSQTQMDDARKEWMQQIQETTKAGNDREMTLVKTMQSKQREADEKIRELEMEAVSLKAKMESTDRRRNRVEEELAEMRTALGNKQNSGLEMMRMQTELTHVRERKEKLEEDYRKQSMELDELKKKLKAVARQCEMEKTKLSMNYEKQISILESRLLS